MIHGQLNRLFAAFLFGPLLLWLMRRKTSDPSIKAAMLLSRALVNCHLFWYKLIKFHLLFLVNTLGCTSYFHLAFSLLDWKNKHKHIKCTNTVKYILWWDCLFVVLVWHYSINWTVLKLLNLQMNISYVCFLTIINTLFIAFQLLHVIVSHLFRVFPFFLLSWL